jgi:uncharacterized membrane protein HdeD (DUF308 family)
MTGQHSHNWWAFAIRGLLALAFGFIALLMPLITLFALVLLFAAWAIVGGAFSLVSGLRGTPQRRRDWWMVAVGLASIIAGVVAFLWPDMTALALLIFIGAWAVVTGGLEVVAAYQLRDRIRGELLLALDGVISIAFGVFVIAFPGAGALAVTWLIGAYALVSGMVLLVLAVRLYQHQRTAHPRPRESGAAI